MASSQDVACLHSIQDMVEEASISQDVEAAYTYDIIKAPCEDEGIPGSLVMLAICLTCSALTSININSIPINQASNRTSMIRGDQFVGNWFAIAANCMHIIGNVTACFFTKSLGSIISVSIVIIMIMTQLSIGLQAASLIQLLCYISTHIWYSRGATPHNNKPFEPLGISMLYCIYRVATAVLGGIGPLFWRRSRFFRQNRSTMGNPY